MTTTRWLARTAKPQAPLIAVITVAQILLALVGIAMAWLLKEIIDSAVAQNAQAFATTAALLVGLILAQAALQALNRQLGELARATLENRYKSRLLRCIFTGDYAAVCATHSGEWLNRLTSDTQVVANGMADIIPGLLSMAAKLLGGIALLAVLLPQLAVALLLGGAAVVVTSALFRKVMKRLHKRVQEADGRFRVLATERLASQVVVRAFGREEATLSEAEAAMGAHKQARMRRTYFWNACNVGFSLAINGAYVLGAIWCGYSILQGHSSYGTFVAVIQLVSQIQAPLANISGYVPRFFAMTASAERLIEAERMCGGAGAGALEVEGGGRLGAQAAVASDAALAGGHAPAAGNDAALAGESASDAAAELPDFDALALENVCFAYAREAERTPVLNDFCMRISAGSCTALAGPSGAGKSTVLKLLLGLYRAEGGRCCLYAGGASHPLDASTRGLFAYVPQGNFLMTGSIRACVSFGDAAEDGSDDARIRAALYAACADDFVAALPQGLNTQLGEHGAGISEGQMQRLAIARAVYSGRPVLLLDECTSSLDAATEQAVLQRLRELPGKTIVIVSHRPAALELADQVVEVEPAG